MAVLYHLRVFTGPRAVHLRMATERHYLSSRSSSTGEADI